MPDMKEKRLVIASDHAGFEYKRLLSAYIREALGWTVVDLGPSEAQRCDYPDYAGAVARHVQKQPMERGILICGSGIGMSMAVNRFDGVRGALVHSAISARLARQHNDANVLCLGERLLGIEVAKSAIEAFLSTPFEGGRHAQRVEKIDRVAGSA